MHSAFQYLYNFSEVEKHASVQAANAKKEALEQAEAARIAEKRRAAEEREAQLLKTAQEAIEKAENERLEVLRAEEARAEAARAEATRLEAQQAEAARAEAERQEADQPELACVVSGPATISDPRLSVMEKTLEAIQEEQKAIRQTLAHQEASNANMQSMLAQILAKLSGPSTSGP